MRTRNDELYHSSPVKTLDKMTCHVICFDSGNVKRHKKLRDKYTDRSKWRFTNRRTQGFCVWNIVNFSVWNYLQKICIKNTSKIVGRRVYTPSSQRLHNEFCFIFHLCTECFTNDVAVGTFFSSLSSYEQKLVICLSRLLW